jgi:flagellar motor switch protein FliG
MSSRRDIVITVYGHNSIIDKIAASSFSESKTQTYCDTINSLELNGNSWVFAKKISENAYYSLETFLPLKFDIFLTLDDRAIQRVLREVGFHDQTLAIALKGTDEKIREKIYTNLSERAAQMLMEDMIYIGPVRLIDVEESRERILNIIRRLEKNGEIIISYTKEKPQNDP